ncbi:MAG: YdeI/OmpD-associated family protein [Devosiaceae bacterium]|nr:YdeI/OmpD-associated family protein [Devosiaceae bacterium MH13]
MSFYPHQFEGEISTHDVGSDRYVYTVIWLPEELEDALPFTEYPRLRIEGEVGGLPYKGACMPVRGRHYLLLSAPMLEAMGAVLSDQVDVRFAIADQDAVDVPVPLVHALQEAPDMQALWDALTPGKQRGLAYMVASAKTAPTIAKRITQVFEMMTGKRDARGKLIAQPTGPKR